MSVLFRIAALCTCMLTCVNIDSGLARDLSCVFEDKVIDADVIMVAEIRDIRRKLGMQHSDYMEPSLIPKLFIKGKDDYIDKPVIWDATRDITDRAPKYDSKYDSIDYKKGRSYVLFLVSAGPIYLPKIYPVKGSFCSHEIEDGEHVLIGDHRKIPLKVFVENIKGIIKAGRREQCYDKYAYRTDIKTVHKVEAGEFDPLGWVDANSTEGNFSIKIPSKYDDYSTGYGSHCIDGINHKVGRFLAQKTIYRDGAVALGVYKMYLGGSADFQRLSYVERRWGKYDCVDIKSIDQPNGPYIYRRSFLSGNCIYSLSVWTLMKSDDTVFVESYVKKFFESILIKQ